jgi:hypothetical protein
MKQPVSAAILAMILVASLTLLAASCQPQTTIGDNSPPVQASPLYDAALNQELNNITNPANAVQNNSAIAEPAFKEFIFNYTPRAEARYDFAKEDVFTLTNGSLNSSKLAVMGIMIGDNYTTVMERLGIPDVSKSPTDRSYTNLEYGHKIGIGGNTTALTIHLENDSVTRISMRTPFVKYLHGNTSFKKDKNYIYSTFNLPDYQDFTSYYKVFHYVSKGIDLYTNKDKIEVISLLAPMKFKGVTYVSVRQEIAPGLYANITQAVLK